MKSGSYTTLESAPGQTIRGIVYAAPISLAVWLGFAGIMHLVL